MSEVTRDEVRRKVTSVGNSWIVCKSKSHPGHVYYFNSLTGEAAWNLSDAEIEKAKHHTKNLECIPGAKPTKCPEPKDKPPSSLLNNFKPPHTLLNEPLIINKVTEQQSSVFNYSNFGNSNATLCTNLSQAAGVLQDTQINNPTSINPVQLMPFNNPIGTYSLNSTTSIYNPKVWDVPQAQQIFVAPTMAPLLNQNASAVNVAFNNISQAMPGLFFNNIENVSHIKQGVITRESRTYYPRENNYGSRVHRGISKKSAFSNSNKNDLRQKIAIRKRFHGKHSNFSEGLGNRSNNSNARKPETSSHTDIPNDIEIDSVDVTDGIMKERLETHLHETPSKINVMPLKCLAAPDANLDAWYILVDLGVLLNEFKFLTMLTDSDEKCHLMVPKRVMEELKTYVTCTENIQARRILRFLSQQIEIGYAYMADEPSNVEGDDMADVILKTCEELLDNKYHVILICDDNEVLTRASSNIHMFSTDEIKNLLLDNSNKQTELSVPVKKTFSVNELLNKIKITVPNNTSQITETTSSGADTEDKPVLHINGREIQKQNEIQEVQKQNNIKEIHNRKPNNIKEIHNRKPNNKKEEKKAEECPTEKHTVDACIQTDFDDISTCSRASNMVEHQTQNVDSKIPQNTKEIAKTLPEPLLSNISEKKREIKLKRSTSHQAPNLESEKKQFKWRRRRNTAPPPVEQKSSQSDEKPNEEKIESPRKNTQDVIQIDITSDRDPTRGNAENTILDESFGSRESSIYTDVRNSTTKENITIEETSTSGIISNSDSNVDAEINNSYLTKSPQKTFNGQSPRKPMYEVDSISMEEYLKMKCDEWVSRFIQIMEEVLSQVLEQDPPFIHKDMPPPWTLHEATQCVALKFSTQQDIKDAANKLSSMLFNVSDVKGKITMNMTPYQYMQMYSYGVHLLAAIKRVTSSCEDIQIAVESLNKLLHDIRNPNLDGSTNDTFNDNIHDNMSSNAVSVYSDVQDNNDGSSLLGQEALQPDSVEPKKRKSSETDLPTAVKFIRKININSSFFKNLSHHKINSVNNNVVGVSNSSKPDLQSLEEERSNKAHSVDINNMQTANEASGKTIEKPNNQPSIVRKFTICPELEAKMQSSINIGHYDEEDYDDDYGEYLTEEYCSEDDNYSLQHNDEISSKTNGIVDTNKKLIPANLEVDPLIAEENTKKFKYMMCMLLQEIKKALCEVRILCDQCYKELEKSEQSSELKCELQKMVERAHLHIIRLCRSLESMLDHETNPTENVQDNNDGSSLLGQEALQPDSVEPKKRKSSETDLPTAVKFIRKININSSFFKNLSHHKINSVNNNVVGVSNSSKPDLQSLEEERSNKAHSVDINNMQTANEASGKTIEKPNNQPSIVRKFTICPELEAKMQSSINIGHYDEEDYDDDYGEYLTEEYCSEDDNYSLQHNDEISSKTNGIVDTNKKLIPANLEVDPLIAEENTKKFKYMMCMLLQEIKKALCEVRILCDQCYKELEKSEQSSELKCELQKMVERAHLHIIRLCRSLESMLDHETNPTESMCKLLKQADINISHVDAGLLYEYRLSVAKCKNHANEFLNSIQNIISGFKT
uniref:Uncharacterized protein n=1 Tax=Heliothis virescens TaxID=7102 RepID=A0A2A4JUY5_HELVI